MDKHEKTANKIIHIYLLKGMHFTLSIALFLLAWLVFRFYKEGTLSPEVTRYDFYILGAYAAVLHFFNRTYNSYLLGYSRIRALVYAQILSQVFTVFVIYFFVSVAWFRFDSPAAFAVLIPAQLLLDISWSYFGNARFYKLNPPRSMLLIYRNERDRLRFRSMRGKPMERLYTVTDEIMFDGSFAELEERLRGYDSVFVVGVNSRCRNGILKYCKENDIPGFFLPHVGDVILREAEHIQAFDIPVLYMERSRLVPFYAFVKRVFDICASFAAILLLSPLMLITALSIRLYDHGPAIYKQWRLTKNGRAFKILKFRSMRVDAEGDGVARLSAGDRDDRITPVGRLIRKCRIDELPQLFNILKGDMSIVGPRPERPEIAEKYYETLPDYKLRLQVKAGLTGYAQVYGKYNSDPYEKLGFDLLYISHMDVLTDLQIMFATLPVLFKSESTEGFDPSNPLSRGEVIPGPGKAEEEIYTQ